MHDRNTMRRTRPLRGRSGSRATHVVRDRRVVAVRRDADGDIVALCNEGAGWSPRSKQDVIDDYEHGGPGYYVQDGWGRSNVQVSFGATEKFLRLDPNGLCRLRLDDLPDG